MSRLQFRVWDKNKQKMSYDNFIIRHGNASSEEFYSKQNELYAKASISPIQRPEYCHLHAEPLEIPTRSQHEQICKIMKDISSSYSLIDWSNFYFENYVTMQATGFHDKNNKLIWEGDLLKFGDTIDVVSWYYSNYIWNGQMIADFRTFDEYGNQIDCNIDFYQGEIFGLQTENTEIVGNIFEDGKKFGFVDIDSFKPSVPV